MSKFIDRLNQLRQAEPQPMGFKTAKITTRPRIMLIAWATQDFERLADSVSGADAGLLRIPDLVQGIEMLHRLQDQTPGVIWGGWVNGIKEELTRIPKTDCDFLVFPAGSTSPAVLQNTEIGKVLEVEASLSEGLLRSINALSVDSVLIDSNQTENALTVRQLMSFQRFSNFVARPLLTTLPPDVTPDELKALWGAGISGVLLKVSPDQPAGSVKELREAIDKMTFPSQRKRGEAIVPYPSFSKETPAEEEEE